MNSTLAVILPADRDAVPDPAVPAGLAVVPARDHRGGAPRRAGRGGHLLRASTCRRWSPRFAAAGVITFLFAWNNFLWPKVILVDNAYQTLPMLLSNMRAGLRHRLRKPHARRAHRVGADDGRSSSRCSAASPRASRGPSSDVRPRPHRRPRVRQGEPARPAFRPPVVRLPAGGGDRDELLRAVAQRAVEAALREEPRARRPRLRAGGRRRLRLGRRAGTRAQCSCSATTARSTPTCSTRGTATSSSSPGRSRSGTTPSATYRRTFTLEHPLEDWRAAERQLPRRGERRRRVAERRLRRLRDGLVHSVGVRPHRRVGRRGEHSSWRRWSGGAPGRGSRTRTSSGSRACSGTSSCTAGPACTSRTSDVVTDVADDLSEATVACASCWPATGRVDARIDGAGELDGDDELRRPHREPAAVERGGPSPVRPHARRARRVGPPDRARPCTGGRAPVRHRGRPAQGQRVPRGLQRGEPARLRPAGSRDDP